MVVRLFALCAALLCFAVAGCGEGVTALPGVLALVLSVTSATLAACGCGRNTAGNPFPCCQSGVITTCYCPAGWSCNYWFTNCGNGTCEPGDGSVACDGGDADVLDVADAPDVSDGTESMDTPPDAPDVIDDATATGCSGTWQPCCVSGLIASCCCPAGIACNYFYTDCGNGTCASLAMSCPDAGPG